jgi:hypothetical protein
VEPRASPLGRTVSSLAWRPPRVQLAGDDVALDLVFARHLCQPDQSSPAFYRT